MGFFFAILGFCWKCFDFWTDFYRKPKFLSNCFRPITSTLFGISYIPLNYKSHVLGSFFLRECEWQFKTYTNVAMLHVGGEIGEIFLLPAEMRTLPNINFSAISPQNFPAIFLGRYQTPPLCESAAGHREPGPSDLLFEARRRGPRRCRLTRLRTAPRRRRTPSPAQRSRAPPIAGIPH